MEGFGYQSWRFIYSSRVIQISILEVFYHIMRESDIHRAGLYIPLEGLRYPSWRFIYSSEGILMLEVYIFHSRDLDIHLEGFYVPLEEFGYLGVLWILLNILLNITILQVYNILLERFRYPSWRFIYSTGGIQISIFEFYIFHWRY